MLHIGCHLSSSKGFAAMGKTALSIGADTFAFFTRNPRGSKARETDPRDVEKFQALWETNRAIPLVAHAPYTLNPASTKEDVRTFARETIADDLRKMEMVPGNYYNMHPGNHLGQGSETGISLIAQCLNAVLDPALSTTLLLETMAGKGTEVGRTFGELRAIIDRLDHPEKVGVCLDTCHVWDGGYDIGSDLNGVLEEFDRTLGLDRLKAIHLNDSKNPLGAHKDRHEKLGQGCIGLETLKNVVNHPALRDLPFILETPNDLTGYQEEIALMRQAREEGEKA
ncbi:deoxyribonuclease IV [Acidaminococcus fermentans]|uniref:deoxyribonuclease IV n=1 Tax=Acidaminococcus fermentans TaxID=905 RepID=UPI000D103BC1|nr:deoxyribonuclease IV [Acidaminococcus fermentans]MCI6286374.1 deoxyribonuclease IV [Acidaminococcus fermentans]MDD7196392.1 deoxyribonuclease IV [Acidaminococcus fermentans]MDY2852822.1 deoxyribonuclease IV [Acidaminococcus fermentans]MDY4147144.1 deoxyribonuclease IV [Acidaminococcus fermentans]MEE0338413.1 deoxyribonuclease IV [Acidaminococcus fermentans]